jgi:hypothetical protein
MGSTEIFETTRRGRWHRALLAVLTVALVLPVSAFTSADSTGRSTSLPGKCKTARQKFSAWVGSDHLADDAIGQANAQWTSVDPNLQPGDALTAAINQYNALLQTAQQAQASADQDLAAANKAIKGCRQSSLPKACKREFATYKPIMDNAAASSAIHSTQIQANADEQQAQLASNVDAFNVAVDRYNAARDQHNQLVDTYNNNLHPAYNDAHGKCSKAA